MKGLKKPAHCRLPTQRGSPQFATRLFRCYDLHRYYANAFSSSLHPVEPRLHNGDEEARTPGLRRAKAALSQLSYIPGQNNYELSITN